MRTASYQHMHWLAVIQTVTGINNPPVIEESRMCALLAINSKFSGNVDVPLPLLASIYSLLSTYIRTEPCFQT